MNASGSQSCVQAVRKRGRCLQDGNVQDYLFDQTSCDWVHWMKTVPQQELSPTLAFNEIIVQTIDTVRYSYLMRLLITHGHHTLFTGWLHMLQCSSGLCHVSLLAL